MSRRANHGITDLRTSAVHRKLDAWKLIAKPDPDHGRGAVYMGGYAIECKLKALALEVNRCKTLEELAERWKIDENEVYHHGLEVFFKRLGLWENFKQSGVWVDFVREVNHWRVSWRYNRVPVSLDNARSFLRAMDRVFNWLESNRY